MANGSLVSHGKVLIVDDEADVLTSTQLLLRVLGYPSVPLKDHRGVMDAARRERPDLILQDLRMSGLDVAKVVRELRTDPATARIPIVLFSADPELATTAAELDADGFLAKPFDKNELEQILERMMPAAAATGSTIEVDARLTRIRARLHEYWNVYSALNAYTQTLLAARDLPETPRRAAEELDRSLLRLERVATELQAEVLATLREGEPRRPSS